VAGRISRREARAQLKAAKFLRARRGVPIPTRAGLAGALPRQPLHAGGAVATIASGGSAPSPVASAQPSPSSIPGAAQPVDYARWFSGPAS